MAPPVNQEKFSGSRSSRPSQEVSLSRVATMAIFCSMSARRSEIPPSVGSPSDRKGCVTVSVDTPGTPRGGRERRLGQLRDNTTNNRITGNVFPPFPFELWPPPHL